MHFICTIQFGLLESNTIILFRDLVDKIIEAKVEENDFFLLFSATLSSIIFRIKPLNKVILDDSNRPNRIVQINFLHVICSHINI